MNAIGKILYTIHCTTRYDAETIENTHKKVHKKREFGFRNKLDEQIYIFIEKYKNVKI